MKLFLGLDAFIPAMLICLSILVPQMAQAISEMNEGEYFSELENTVFPEYYRGESGSFTAKDGVSIAYRKFERDEERGALIILPDRGEPMLKYAEVIHDLADLNLSIYIMEHRGQGESDLIDNVPIQFVRNYDEYVQDFTQFMARVNERPHSKRFLLAHSMGGAIASLYALTDVKAFDAAVFSAPMYDMSIQNFPKAIAKPLAWTLCTVLRMGKWLASEDNAQLSSSVARRMMTNRVDSEFPGTITKKISYQWALASLRAIKNLHKNSRAFQTPYLMLQAEKDQHVPATGQNRFCENTPGYCKKVVLKDSFHEILQEKDSIRDQALSQIRAFFTKKLDRVE